jgi:hypothetical protein
MNDAQLAERAHKAKTLLDNPMYQEGFEMVHKAILKRIEECPMADVAAAEDLRKCLRLLRDVRANLEHAISQGKLISFRLEQERAQQERVKKFHLIPNFYR